MQTKTVFTHEARAPRLPSCHVGVQQRRFLYSHEHGAAAAIVRFANSDRAQVELSTRYQEHCSASVYVDMDAKQLLEFAMALIDAAHDLQTVETLDC